MIGIDFALELLIYIAALCMIALSIASLISTFKITRLDVKIKILEEEILQHDKTIKQNNNILIKEACSELKEENKKNNDYIRTIFITVEQIEEKQKTNEKTLKQIIQILQA